MTKAEAPLFVPVVVDAVATAPAVCKERKASPRCKPKPDAGIIEIQIEGITNPGWPRGERPHDRGHRTGSQMEGSLGQERDH